MADAQFRAIAHALQVCGNLLTQEMDWVSISAGHGSSRLPQRGRERLRQLATEPEDVELPMLSDEVRERLKLYVDGFRTGDFDAVRQMLSDDVKLDLVGKFSAQGKGTVGEYYGRYAAAAAQWAYAAGVVEGRPAMLVFDRKVSLETPAYFVALTFDGGRVAAIHDFLFARYAIDGVDLLRWDRAP